MHSSLIGKVEKAKRYAQEPERFSMLALRAEVRGDNDAHEVVYADGTWHCNCNFFSGWNTCQHVMALQRMLGRICPEEKGAEEPQALTATV